MEANKTQSKSAWINTHLAELSRYSGQWIAFNQSGVLFSDTSFTKTFDTAKILGIDYSLHFVHPFDYVRPPQFKSVRFRAFNKQNWLPIYEVKLTAGEISIPIEMLVDTGADFSLITLEIGKSLGLEPFPFEPVYDGEGVGSVIKFLLRDLEMEIDGHKLIASVAWLQSDEITAVLLGRKVVFDQFDVEFKQAEKLILFKKRPETLA